MAQGAVWELCLLSRGGSRIQTATQRIWSQSEVFPKTKIKKINFFIDWISQGTTLGCRTFL